MDWLALSSTFPTDKDMPARTARLNALTKVRDNTLYDGLAYSFDQEFHGSGEYVPLRQRRPSVRSGLCRVVVEDAVSLLFSEGHWPAIQATNADTVDGLAQLVKATRLNETMLDGATRGSIGSVVFWLRVLDGKPFYDVLETPNLTPTWAPNDPSRLVSVREKYKVKGRDLQEQGYPIQANDRETSFWFQRIWDEANETWFTPWRTTDDTVVPQKDPERSVNHGLGFVPLYWTKNLTGGTDPDGACTFEAAIDTVIEGDYLLSQAGRGLNYSSDPKTVLTIEGAAPAIAGGAANALVLPQGSDAKLLEINGRAAETVLAHVRELRAIALEAVHGNRAPAERISAAQSGRALEVSLQGLIHLADRLRVSYGEGALLALLRMTCAASQAIEGGLTIGEQDNVKLNPAGLELRWQDWMPPTPQDLLTTAQAVVTAFAGGVVSLKTAVTRMASLLNVDDATAELQLVEDAAALKQQQALEQAQASRPDPTAVRDAAGAGKQDTRQNTA